jgi:hypothetical protein
MKKLSLLLFTCVLFFTLSCGKDAASCDVNTITALSKKVETAANAYLANQSKANCNAYVSAISDYLEQLTY